MKFKFCKKDEKVIDEGLTTLKQIHSNKVVIVDKAGKDIAEADAMVTKVKGIGLGIKTADCVPVLFADEENGVIGAAHAGYKGAFGGVLENTILKMIELGAFKENIKAMIGPCIHQKSYEVDAEFYRKVLVMDEENKVYFIPSKNDNHYMFDLKKYVFDRLKGCKISDVNIDTYENEDYNSYRRNCHKNVKDDKCRNWSIITLL